MVQNSPRDVLSPDLLATAVKWRRHLHQHPELAYQERKTSDFVAAQLTQHGLTIHRGLGGTGVLGTLTRGTSQRTIAIRADMDALPVHEQNDTSYASETPGVMHACGHDGHVAMALAAAVACAQLPDLDGTVHFIFQPAEEGGAGAKKMIDDGLFRVFPCDAIFALHNWPALQVGACAARDGAMMAANAVFEIEVRGRGCHGAMPHQGSDSILAGCHLVSAIQSIVSRNIDPLESAVISVTQVRAGHAHNVIPDSCSVRGAARWFDRSVGDCIERRVKELAHSVAASFSCEANVLYERRYPATVNDPAAARLVRDVASTAPVNLRTVDVPPSMVSEDFAFMLNVVPGCYFWLGAARAGNSYGLHSSRYDFNDDSLPHGATFWVELVKRLLTKA